MPGQRPAPQPGQRPAPQPWVFPATASATPGSFPVTPPFGGPAGYSPFAVPRPPVRPLGISVLAVTEVGIGIAGLVAAWLFFSWAGFMSDIDMSSTAIDMLVGMAYIVATGANFTIASAFWRMRPWAWPAALALEFVLVGLIAFSIYRTDIGPLDVIGLVVHGCVLVGLTLTPVRAQLARA